MSPADIPAMTADALACQLLRPIGDIAATGRQEPKWLAEDAYARSAWMS
jgi:hypothetical protein